MGSPNNHEMKKNKKNESEKGKNPELTKIGGATELAVNGPQEEKILKMIKEDNAKDFEEVMQEFEAWRHEPLKLGNGENTLPPSAMIFWMAYFGSEKIFEKLLSLECVDAAYLNQTLPEDAGAFAGYTPMTILATKNKARIIEQLLQAGADPGLTAHGAPTPSLVASKAGFTEVCYCLMKYYLFYCEEKLNDQIAKIAVVSHCATDYYCSLKNGEDKKEFVEALRENAPPFPEQNEDEVSKLTPRLEFYNQWLPNFLNESLHAWFKDELFNIGDHQDLICYFQERLNKQCDEIIMARLRQAICEQHVENINKLLMFSKYVDLNAKYFEFGVPPKISEANNLPTNALHFAVQHECEKSVEALLNCDEIEIMLAAAVLLGLEKEFFDVRMYDYIVFDEDNQVIPNLFKTQKLLNRLVIELVLQLSDQYTQKKPRSIRMAISTTLSQLI